MCKKYSRSRGKVGKNVRDPYSRNVRENISTLGGVKRIDLGNLLENFNTDIWGEMGSQLDALHAKKRQDEEWVAMRIFFQDVGPNIPKGNVH